MKKLLLILILGILFSCSNSKIEKPKPFKVGDIAYFKIDSTKVVIVMDLGQVDNDNYWYLVSCKKNNEVTTKSVLSSSLFK